MLRRFFWIILSCMMALSLVLASCATTEEEEEEEGPPPTEEEEEEEEEEGPPVGGDWWDKYGEPEYGGTITWRAVSSSSDFDPYNSWGGNYKSTYLESLWQYDWTLDREIWAYQAGYTPHEYWVGRLAESWETPDLETIIVHIRQGINWQDKPPVNGREFTAYDVEYSYDRILGTGHGFTMISPWHAARIGAVEKVTATDKYTAVFKFKYPSIWSLLLITELSGQNYIVASEWVEQGDLDDWRNAVGTGPWMLTDYVVSSSVTYSRNSNYWGYDERHPENQLPYADIYRIKIIPDIATAMAALRTGKIDVMHELDWEQAASLARTNPELQHERPPRPGETPVIRVDKAPFTDIKVRKALNMAIDRQTIAETLFGGTVDGKPCGLVSEIFKDYSFPYSEWPQELKDEYSYNPEGARELLAEAGYPDGFKTNIIAATGCNLSLVETIRDYLLDIGVDMEIRLMESAAASAITRSKQHDALTWNIRGGTGSVGNIQGAISMRYSTDSANGGCVNDPAYDALIDQFVAATDLDEAKRLAREANRYALEQHWAIQTFPVAYHNVFQPYLKGHSGETLSGGGVAPEDFFTRLWIDQDMKKEMGR